MRPNKSHQTLNFKLLSLGSLVVFFFILVLWPNYSPYSQQAMSPSSSSSSSLTLKASNDDDQGGKKEDCSLSCFKITQSKVLENLKCGKTRGPKVLSRSGQYALHSAGGGEHELLVGTRRRQRPYWNAGSRLDVGNNSSVWGDNGFGERYRHAATGESDDLLLPNSSNKPLAKEYGGKSGRMLQYSGPPLMSGGEKLEEMVKQHEQQIQLLLRKAALDHKLNP